MPARGLRWPFWESRKASDWRLIPFLFLIPDVIWCISGLHLNFGILHPDGRLIDLEVVAGHQAGLDAAPERLRGDAGRFHPATQGRPGDVDPGAPEFLLNPVEGRCSRFLAQMTWPKSPWPHSPFSSTCGGIGV